MPSCKLLPGPPGMMLVDLGDIGVVPFSDYGDVHQELYKVFQTKDKKMRDSEEGPDGLAGVAWRALGDLRIKVFSVLIDVKAKCEDQQEEVDYLLMPFHRNRKSIVDMLGRDIAALGSRVKKLTVFDIPEAVAEVTNLIFDACLKDGNRIRYADDASWMTDNQRFVRGSGLLVERLKNPNPEIEQPVPSTPTGKYVSGSLLGKRNASG